MNNYHWKLSIQKKVRLATILLYKIIRFDDLILEIFEAYLQEKKSIAVKRLRP